MDSQHVGAGCAPLGEHRIARPCAARLVRFTSLSFTAGGRATIEVPQKGFDEADISTKSTQAGEATRLSPSHVDARWPGDSEGPSPTRAGPPVSLTGRPNRVRGRSTFRALATSSSRARSGPVTVHFLQPSDGGSGVSVAYAVGRHVGGAVVRNRWRRRLRAIAAEASPDLAPGAYLVGVGRGVVELRFGELKEQVITTMRRASGDSR